MPAPPTRPWGGLTLILAHPDDESFFAAGSAAAAAAEGRRVELIVASRGEAGSLPPGDTLPRDQLAATRSAELRAAAGAIGVNEIHWLGLADRGVGAFGPADVDAVATLLRSQRPAVVFTFAADGFNGHPDHVASHQLAHAAIRRAMDPDAPLSPPPLVQPRVVETTSVDPWHDHDDAALRARGADYMIDVTRHRHAKRRALEAHRTQRHLITPRFFPDGAERGCRYEVFRHAAGPPPGAVPAPSLFAGLS